MVGTFTILLLAHSFKALSANAGSTGVAVGRVEKEGVLADAAVPLGAIVLAALALLGAADGSPPQLINTKHTREYAVRCTRAG